jgi:hypothetical protein
MAASLDFTDGRRLNAIDRGQPRRARRRANWRARLKIASDAMEHSVTRHVRKAHQNSGLLKFRRRSPPRKVRALSPTSAGAGPNLGKGALPPWTPHQRRRRATC